MLKTSSRLSRRHLVHPRPRALAVGRQIRRLDAATAAAAQVLYGMLRDKLLRKCHKAKLNSRTVIRIVAA